MDPVTKSSKFFLGLLDPRISGPEFWGGVGGDKRALGLMDPRTSGPKD